MPFRLTPVNLASLIQPSPTNESCYLLYRSRKSASTYLTLCPSGGDGSDIAGSPC